MATDIRTHPNGTASDADFRAFASAVEAAILAMGWTRTTDTGQINLATVTNPAVNTAGGYAVYQMNDTLQATKPVVIRVDYLNGQHNYDHGLYVALGLGGTDGAGGLQTPKSTTFRLVGMFTPTSSNYSLRTSGATNRLTLFGGVGTPIALNVGFNQAATPFGFSVERSHNDDGTDSSEGAFIVIYTSDPLAGAYPSRWWDCQYVSYDNQFGANVGANAVSNTQGGNRLPMPWYDSGSMVVGLSVGTIPLFMPRAGVKNPSQCLAGYETADLTHDIVVTLTEYGGVKTFRTLGSWLMNMSNNGAGAQATNGAGNPNAGCMMRWE